MGEWLLILFLTTSYSDAITSHVFYNKARCEEAGKAATKLTRNISFVCVKK